MAFFNIKEGLSKSIQRAIQFTEEKFGNVEKTEYDSHFENLLQRADQTQTWTQKILSVTETVLQPNPALRIEESLYQQTNTRLRERLGPAEEMGHVLIDAGNDLGSVTTYGNALVKCGQTELRVGQANKEFVSQSANSFLHPMHNFLEGDMKTIMKERNILEGKRLDLDAAKLRLKRVKIDAQKKAIKMDSPQILELQFEVEQQQREFDRQLEITKLLLEAITSNHAHHLRCLCDFVEAQMNFYAKCHQHMQDLHRQLGSLRYNSPRDSPLLSRARGSVSSFGSVSSLNRVAVNNCALSAAAAATAMATATAVSSALHHSDDKRLLVRALYDYHTEEEGEMSLMADELLLVLPTPKDVDSDLWCLVERVSLTDVNDYNQSILSTQEAQRGIVPSAYLIDVASSLTSAIDY